MKTIVHELEVKIYLMKDVNCNESHESVANLIDTAFSKDEKYLVFHNENKYKNYCFNNLYPMEQDYIFKNGKIYTFKIRTVDEDIAKYLANTLFYEYTSDIKVLGVTSKIVPHRYIDTETSITPIVLKFDSGYWRKSEKLSEFEKRIKSNLIKKYNAYHKTKIDENFELFLTFNFKNKKPVPSKYKDVYLLGDKIEFKVANNPMAQELMHFALGTGLGEINSRGFGYMNYRWIANK